MFILNWLNPHPLNRIFSNYNDPRIDFFKNKIDLEQINTLLKLRALMFEGTEFSGARMNHNDYTLTRPAIHGNYGRIIRQARQEDATQLALNILILDRPEVKKSSGYLHLLRDYGQPLAGVQHLAYFSMIALVIFLALIEQTRQADNAHNELFNRNIKNKICNWVIDGCSGQYGVRYDCYLPNTNDCKPGGSENQLRFATFIIFCIGIWQLLKVRSNCVTEIMHNEFNDEEYDSLLNDICAKEQELSIDWNTEIKISDTQCSLRTFALTLLCSFDDKAYKDFFAEIIPNLLTDKPSTLKTGAGYTLAVARCMPVNLDGNVYKLT